MKNTIKNLILGLISLLFVVSLTSCSPDEDVVTPNSQFVLTNGTNSVNMEGTKWYSKSRFIIYTDSTISDTTNIGNIDIWRFLDENTIKLESVVGTDTLLQYSGPFNFQNDTISVSTFDFYFKLELINDTTFQTYQSFQPSGTLVVIFKRF